VPDEIPRDEGEEDQVECCATISCATTNGEIIPSTLRLLVTIKGKNILALIDYGSTHNFIHPRVVKDRDLPTVTKDTLSVETIEGRKTMATIVCPSLDFIIG